MSSKFNKISFKTVNVFSKFQNSFNGLRLALRSEKLLSYQMVLGGLIILGAILLQRWWFTKQTITFVSLYLTVELINTSFETLCDLVEPNYNKKVKRIKDIISAAAFIILAASTVITLVDFANIMQWIK